MNRLSCCRQRTSRPLCDFASGRSSPAFRKSPLAAIFLVAFALAITCVFAEEYPFDASLYDAQTITVQLVSSGEIALSGSGQAQRLEAKIQYVPEEAEEITTDPKAATINPLVFEWRSVRAGTYPFSYTTTVTNNVLRPVIAKKVTYPFASPQTVTTYLAPQEITDSNSAIRAQALSLVGSSSSAMDAVWLLATWVHDNVEYDLNSVTAQASKPSSWVYRNREGVCDELTSLFISMSREAGIPARFVSGYAYTNLDQFPDHWGPHGWAEVWLPDVGWIPVDVTYGQIGYVDATHIPIRHSIDAKNTAIEYELLAQSLTMQPGELVTTANVLSHEGTASEPLSTQVKPLYGRTGSESGNAVTASIFNGADYYVSTQAYLVTTKDTTVLDNKAQNVLLPPKSMRTVTWRVQMPLYDDGYRYTVPFTVLVQRAENASTTVEGGTALPVYPLLPKQEQKVSSIIVSCEEPPLLYTGEQVTVLCASPDNRLCSAGECAQNELRLSFTGEQAGAYPRTVRATHGAEVGNAIVTFVVEEPPRPSISISLPQQATPDDSVTLQFTVTTSVLTDVAVTVQSQGINQEWHVDSLTEKSFELRFPATYLDVGENTLQVQISGKDKNGREVTKVATAPITLQATFWERIELFFIHLFA